MEGIPTHSSISKLVMGEIENRAYIHMYIQAYLYKYMGKHVCTHG